MSKFTAKKLKEARNLLNITQEEADAVDMSFVDEIYEKSDIKSSKKK